MGGRGGSSSFERQETTTSSSYKDIEKMTTREMRSEMNKLEKELLKKYSDKELNSFRSAFDEANTLYGVGSEYEDKKGTDYAQKHYYDEADKLVNSVPKEYKRFRELDNELW